jgi:hypothetical protein
LDAGNLKIEFERAIAELQQLCDEDVSRDERKHRLGVRKELNKLLGLYTAWQREMESADDGESEILEEIRQHLEPLGLAKHGTSLPELARLAALAIAEK